jgi:hypothetical protein
MPNVRSIDIGKYLAHWVAVGWAEGATGSVIDYGRIDVPSEDLGVEQAIMVMRSGSSVT